MKIATKILLTAGLGFCLAEAVNSCHQGPAEKAGEKVDQAVQNTKDTVKDAVKDVKEGVNKDR